MVDLSVNLGGMLSLKNPVMTASGTFGYGLEYNQYYDISKLGAVVVKGIRMMPSDGNAMPRTAEVTGGMLNAIGLQGPGVNAFIHNEKYLPALCRLGATVIVNIWGTSIDEYGEVAAALNEVTDKIAALEINISCPNVKAGGAAFGTDVHLAEQVVKRVRMATKLPIITKLSPNVTRISEFAKAAEGAGSDMISLINTLGGTAIDCEKQCFILANRFGGFSGPAVKPVALKMVYETAQAVKIPIIGMGGIMNGRDAVEFLLAGASAIAVGTANFVNPYAPLEIIDFISDYLRRHNCSNVAEIIGKVK